MYNLIIIFVFLTVVFSINGMLRGFSKGEYYRERLKAVLEYDDPRDARKPVSIREILNSLVKSLSSLFAARSFTAQVQSRLVAAGIPLKGEEYITISLGLIILVPLFTYLISANFWLAVIMFILTLILPGIYINIKKARRLQTFEAQLADSVVMMANALRGGFGFQQAMETVVKEMPPPIATEFDWCLREMNLGFSQEEALLHLGERVKSEDLDMVISGIIIQKQVGGNLAQILDNIGDTMRDRARIKKQVRALTAQGKLSGLIIGLLPVALLAIMLVLNPEHVYFLFKDQRGLVMLGAAVVMEIIGAFFINRIIDIEF
ncbi:MAG: secretion system protein [Syntrophomonadaceae bacterium]|nr:secretion system protein [Syntrophomonadaceae bacterium]